MVHSLAAPVARLEIQATGAEVRRASDWLTALAHATQLGNDATYRLEMCLNEALANVIDHGGEQARANTVRLTFSVTDDDGVLTAWLKISDAGSAFSPLAVEQKARADALDDVQPGGLGLLMLRQFADHLSYARTQDRNELTLQVRR